MYGWSSNHLRTRLVTAFRAFSFLGMAWCGESRLGVRSGCESALSRRESIRSESVVVGSVLVQLLERDLRRTDPMANGLHAGARGSFLAQSAVMPVFPPSLPFLPMPGCPSTVRQARADGRRMQARHFGEGMDPDDRLRIVFVADNPGDWPLHCQMLKHSVAGILTWFRVA